MKNYTENEYLWLNRNTSCDIQVGEEDFADDVQNGLLQRELNPTHQSSSTYQLIGDRRKIYQSNKNARLEDFRRKPVGDIYTGYKLKKKARLTGFPVRYIQATLLFLCLVANYNMRVNLSTAIVFMTDMDSEYNAAVFDWTIAEQSLPQIIFFAGYFVTNLVAAVLVTKINNKLLLVVSNLLTTALTLLLPVLVTAGGYTFLVIVRFLLGSTQGFLMASVMAVMSRWIPPVERGRCGALVLGGLHIGNLVSFSLSGWIGSTFGGWPSIFYSSGILGGIWTVLYILTGAESPNLCPYIREEEKKYIEKELAETPTLPKNLPIPWKQMLKSKACWAILLATLGHSWGYWTLVQLIPTYFNAIYEFSPTINGLVTSLPYAFMSMISFPASYVTDMLVKKKIISMTACRKINNTIGHFGSAICLVVLAITRDPTVAIVMYTIGTAVISFAFIGYSINHMDIVPNFAGFLMGITNGLSNFSATSGPLFAGMVVRNTNNADEWGYVFYVSAAVFVAGNLTFITMGTAQIQDFNEIPKEFEVEEGKKTGSVVA